MKRSGRGRGVFDLVERVKTRFGWNRPSPPHESDQAKRPTARRSQIVGAGLVMILPAVIAILIAGSREEPTPEPKVTQVLESISDQPASPPRAKRIASDAPVAQSPAGKKRVGITFDRSSRVAVGYIEIPAIGLETKFYDGVVDEAVKRGPGHWPGTPWPGESGNSVFAGHRTTHTKPFADLDLLKKGQRVRAQVENGPRTTYRVFRTTVVPEAKYADFVLKQPRNKNARTITLFACTPKGFRTHRIVVQAKAARPATKQDAKHKEEGAMGSS